MDPRLNDDESSGEGRTIPSERIPTDGKDQGSILWSATGPPPAGVGDQDGTEFEEGADFLESGPQLNLEKYRLILPPLIRTGYQFGPVLMKKPGAKVSRSNSAYLANLIVDCAYQDPEFAELLGNIPDDCRIAIAGEAYGIYVSSEKYGDKDERSSTLEAERHGRGGAEMGGSDGSPGGSPGVGGEGDSWSQFDSRSPEARIWGGGGFWK